jgi:TrmH family RNA methyltransferase
VLSKNKIKFINSLKQKKFRTETGLFVIEGDKLVSELLSNRKETVVQLVANTGWLRANQHLLHRGIKEITEVSEQVFSKVTSFESPAGVLAVLSIPKFDFHENDLKNQLSIGLDTIQDPGNLGTIIRIADWFGINQVFCSNGCADCFNPKVVQASMGSVLRVPVFYVELVDFFDRLSQFDGFTIYGAFLEGTSIYNSPLSKYGMLVFGNESRGIQAALKKYIKFSLSIPSFSRQKDHVESLNVSAAVAVFCSEFMRRGL